MTAIADRVRISVVEESAFGTTPSSNLQRLRYTSESLKASTNTQRSAEVRGDRQISDVLRLNGNGEGDLNIELSYGTYDDLLAAALYSSGWSTAATVISSSTQVSFTSGTATISLSAGSWASTPTVGSWIRVSGSTDNDGYYKVVSATTTTIVVQGGATLLTTEAAGDSITITEGASISNGTTQTSFSIERYYADLSNVYVAFRGAVISQMNLEIQSGSIVTGSFSFMSLFPTDETSSIGTGYDAATTNRIMNAVENVTGFREGGTRQAITGVSLNLNNNLRSREEVATFGPTSFGAGSIQLSGTVRFYFTTAALFAKYLSFTDTSLSILFSDSDGNVYIIDIPAVKYTDGNRVGGGQDTDIIADLQFEAFQDSTNDVTMNIVRFPAA